MLRAFVSIVLGGLALIACSPGGTSTTSTPSTGATGTGGARTTSTDATGTGATGTGGASATTTGASSGTGGAAPTACPKAEPMVGAFCSLSGVRCSFGDSVIPACRAGYRCVQHAWASDGPACPGPTATCMGADPPAGAPCATQSEVCVAGATVCVCAPCGGAGCPPPPWSFSCAGVSGDAACPPTIPNDGTACAMDGVACAYGVACVNDREATCKAGAWLWSDPQACP